MLCVKRTYRQREGQKVQINVMSSKAIAWRGLLTLLIMLAAWGLAFRSEAHAGNTITVNNTTDPASISGNGFCTLREAINNANAASDTTAGDCTAGTGNDTINFSVSGTITLGSPLPAITGGTLTIDGSGQQVVVDGNNQFQIFFANSNVNLNLLTVQHAYEAGHGGGMFINRSTVTVNNSSFLNNSAFSGCALYNAGGNLTVTNSTIAGNSSGDGCGIANDNGTLAVQNTTFANNHAFNARGADIFAGGPVTVLNSTFLGDNSPDTSIFVGGGTITIGNSILIGYPSPGNCDGPVIDAGYNISSDNSCGFAAPVGGGVDPKLDPAGLQNNGGPTETVALQPSSPAIDAVPVANCPATDQRGVTRPDGAETACDIGAYEYIDAEPPTITISAPTNTTYTLNQPVPSVYSCTDPVAGDAVTVCAGPVADGADIDTASVGSKMFTVNATDSHNLSSSQSVSYTVAYNICPQYDKSHSVKSGATIPIKLDLCDLNGVDLSAVGIAVHATGVVMVSSSATEVLQDAGNSNPDDDFRFDSTLGMTGGYIFNLQTKGYPAGTFNLQFTAGNDPTTHVTSFQVR
jgi:hypothetical protein